VGADVVVLLTGLDAMVADGLDPLAGNYQLVGKDSIAVGIYDIISHSIGIETYKDSSIDPVPGSASTLAPASSSERHSLDITTGDLNGDGVDEQIAAWIDAASGYIHMAIGEMPGTDGRPSSEPAAVAYGDNIDLLVRGYDQALWRAHYNGTNWGNWHSGAGGLLLSGPAIASRGTSAFDAFAVGTDNQLYQRHRDGSAWVGPWTVLLVDPAFSSVPTWTGPPPELPAPAAVARGADEFDVFRVAPDRTLRWSHFNGSTWGTWQGLGGMLATGPGAVVLDDGRAQVFAIGADNALWYLFSEGAGWEMDGSTYDWRRVELDGMGPGVTLASAPTAVETTAGVVNVFVRGSDDALWEVTYDGGWGTWSGGAGVLGSRPTAAVRSTAGLILFAQAADGSLQQSGDGTSWSPLANPWLPACCLGTPIDTGIMAHVTTGYFLDQINILDVETGHFLGDGREQIALAYNSGVNLGLSVFDVRDGFSSLEPLGEVGGIADASVLSGAYYPKLAVGEFDGDAPEEIALAYATRMGGVRVYLHTNYTGTQIAWMKPGTYAMPDYGMNDHISSIRVADGWNVKVYDHNPPGLAFKTFTADDPNLHDDQYSTGGWIGDTISTVEVTAMGPDTINVVTPDGYYDQRNAYIALEIFDIDPQDPTPTSQAKDYFEVRLSDAGNTAPERTLDIVTGDFDGLPSSQGTLDDEVALIWDSYKTWEGDIYNAYFHILDIEPDVTGLVISNHAGKELESHAEWLPDNTKPPYSAEIVLTAGDFDGDGRDEIARTWPEHFDSGDWPDLWRYLQVLDYESGWSTTSIGLSGWTRHSYQDALAAGDLDLDLQDEIIFYDAVYDNLHTYAYSGGSISPLQFENIPLGDNILVLATGDFTGESIRVGPPSYRVQEEMITPVTLLNVPPRHHDIILPSVSATEYELIEWYEPGGDNSSAEYSTVLGGQEESYMSSEREWSLSTGFEFGAGAGGHKVTTSLENTYGEGFSNSSGEINTVSFSDTITAEDSDVVVYNATSYAVYEYPVYGAPGGTGDPETIVVAWPLADPASSLLDTNPPWTRGWPAANACDENFYAPNHQVGNIWSYGHLNQAAGGLEDFDRSIVTVPSGTGRTFTFNMTGLVEGTRTSSSRNQVSAGVEYSYENELSIPLIGKAYEVSFRAYANGTYGQESISTFKTQHSESTEVAVNLATLGPAYDTKSWLYWADAGYLVVDYQTEPGTGGDWSKYWAPDPAFILPWYGFPNEDGEFPSSGPDVPTCGMDRQLFSHDVVIEPQYVDVGDLVTISATVRNFSHNPVSNVVVRFCLGVESCVPADDAYLGETTISPSLDRTQDAANYPRTASIPWTAEGAGEQRIYAVIDPDDAIVEMHDGGDPINNNVSYGLMYVAEADYVDPGLEQEAVYQHVGYELGPDLAFSAYLPTANGTISLRHELIPLPIEGAIVVGEPFRLDVYEGGEPDPEDDYAFGATPAAFLIHYDTAALGGMVEGNLRLYRLETGGSTWSLDASCPGYAIQRFPEDDLIAIPVCTSGTFALADTAPGTIALVADFSADPLSGAAPLEVTFTDLSTGTPGPDSWTWDFGDTTASGDQHPVHIYTDPGIYTVTLTVSNAFGMDGDVKVAYITVLEEEKIYLPLIMR